jgi:hypothetical protein
MASPYLWFKMWLDILDDPKMHRLRDRDFRTFVNLCGFAKEADLGGRIELSTGEIAYRLRVNEQGLTASIERLIKALPDGMSRSTDGSITLNNFKKRQETDSKERTKRWRNKRHGDGHGDNHGDGHRAEDVTHRGLDLDQRKKDLTPSAPAGGSEAPAVAPVTLPKKGACQHHLGCDKRGTIKVNGRWYCPQHDPDQDQGILGSIGRPG